MRFVIFLQWCLIELCKNPEIQSKLRVELQPFSNSDPTWEQLTNGLPYLDAVVHETLRLHAPLEATTRIVCCLIPMVCVRACLAR